MIQCQTLFHPRRQLLRRFAMHRPRFIKTAAALAALLTVTIFGSATGLCAPPDEGTATLVTNADGSSVETRKDGTEITRNKDGSSVVTTKKEPGKEKSDKQ